MSDEPQLFLASRSPRRRELLTQIGVAFEVLSSDVPEARQAGETPADYVERLAQSKAQSVFDAVPGPAIVLGADTVVCSAGQVLEKPRDQDAGQQMLSMLSNTWHQVLTAVRLIGPDGSRGIVCTTQVKFGNISPAMASAYWQTGEPRDKAGGYGIQGYGAVFVEHISGSYSNVVGLPLFETSKLLQQAGLPVWQGFTAHDG